LPCDLKNYPLGKKMKIRSKNLNIFSKVLLILLLAAVFNVVTLNLYSAGQFDAWGISKEAVTKKYIAPGTETIVFTPVKNPDYENKIMNMVKLILKNVDSDADKDISIISTKSNPRIDFLLFKDKLFSVLEVYNSIPKDELKNVIKKLTSQYGEPNYNPGSEMEIYFISSASTKIIVHYYLKSKKCEIYFYDSHLYHKLSSNDF
jgi:hypothetical protein